MDAGTERNIWLCLIASQKIYRPLSIFSPESLRCGRSGAKLPKRPPAYNHILSFGLLGIYLSFCGKVSDLFPDCLRGLLYNFTELLICMIERRGAFERPTARHASGQQP